VNTAAARLYEMDFYSWVQNQADAMRSGNLESLDLDNLVEEIESMGKSQKRAVPRGLHIPRKTRGDVAAHSMPMP